MKGHYCEENLKSIYRDITKGRSTFIKLKLGEWQVLEKDLIPLLIFHNQDKKLSYFNVKTLVKLTELPEEDCPDKGQQIEYLKRYKEAFTNPKVLQVLMEHLSYCL